MPKEQEDAQPVRKLIEREVVGDRIRKARRAAGLTQPQAAALVGLEERQRGRYETGQSEGFMQHLDQIADALQTTEEYLRGDDSEATMRMCLHQLEQVDARLMAIRGEVIRTREVVESLMSDSSQGAGDQTPDS